MKARPFVLGFLLCAVGVFCMAQSTVIRRLRDLADVRLPSSLVGVGARTNLTWNGTVWTNADGPGSSTNFVALTNGWATNLTATNVTVRGGLNSYGAGANSSILGPGAASAGQESVAIGSAANALHNYSVAVGRNTTNTLFDAVAIGHAALTTNQYASALGSSARAGGQNATALGTGAAADYANSTALGRTAQTTTTNQVRLGTAADTVSMPGAASVDGNFTASSGTFTNGLTNVNRTITADSPMLNLEQTWNNGAVPFIALKVNVTNTAAASGSLLAQLGLNAIVKGALRSDGTWGGTSYFALNPATGSLLSTGMMFDGDTPYWVSNGYPFLYFKPNDALLTSFYGFGFCSGAAQPGFGGSVADLYFRREAAGILAQQNTTNAQTYRIYNTYADASNYERGVLDWQTTTNTLRIGTEAAGTGTVRDIQFVGGNVGIGITPAAKLHVNGSLIVTNGSVSVSPAVVSLTADDQVVNCATNSYIRLSSDSAVQADRTFLLSAGTTDGQVLTLEWTGTNAAELNDDSASGDCTVRLAGNWVPTQYDTLTLHFNANTTNWIERARSAN